MMKLRTSGLTTLILTWGRNRISVGKRSLSKMVCVVFVFCAATATVSPAQTLTVLVTFNGANGANPQASLIRDVDGNFYGTTFYGGSGFGFCTEGGVGCGTVFRITPTGALTTLYNFCSQGNCSNGANPAAALVQGADGNFYGTTSQGGDDSGGTVFKITSAGVLTTLHSFEGNDGAYPQAGLILASDGNFYGTTEWGGAHGFGTVFRITPDGTLTTLYSFCAQSGCPDGGLPVAGLIQATSGSLCGTTSSGGNNDVGTVFKITLGGALTTLHSFDGNDGGLPAAGLIQATDGNLYGTTPWGGTGIYGNWGTVFKITPDGTLSTLYNFGSQQSDGSSSDAALVQGTDGNFYGTTSYGNGTIFKITPGGTLSTLYSFSGGTDGAGPDAGLVQSTDGNFYGTTRNDTNCVSNCGTVFRLSVGLSPFIETQPTSGTVGAPVTILGTNLTGATSVTFNGTPATFTVVSDSEITTNVPAGATTGTVQVTTPGGTLTSNADFQVTGPLQFVPVTPCRLVDTRPENGGSGPIQGGTSQSFSLPQLGNCGIPTSAAAYSLNVTVVPQGPLGYLTIWPNGEVQPYVSTLNSADGRVKANAAIVPAGNNAVSVYVSDTTDVILDIDGYFGPASQSTLAFYPLPPCRVADTRDNSYPQGLGPPSLAGGVARDFPVLNATACNIPNTAKAYSLNFTAVPPAPLGFLTVWPTGQKEPGVSTLNAFTGAVTANAAIVPAGTMGEISTYASDNTDLVIDVNGYFAPPGQGGLSLYPTAPCRLLDTRPPLGNGPFSGTLSPAIDVLGGPCGVPAQAQAYVFNATVVPQGGLNYLTLWPDGQQQPLVSTLNAFDGAVTSNMAMVPAGTQGKVDAYANGLTDLILDISSYFAP